MAHGQPDFGQFTGKITTYALSDMAELAARLKSIVTFDRRGDVVWLDDFEDNIAKWEFELGGVGAAIALSNEAARNGARSAKLTTGNLINDYATIRKYLPYPTLSKVGFEISFTLVDSLSFLRFILDLYDGTNEHLAVIDYRRDVGELYYLSDVPAFVLLESGLFLFNSQYHFHTMKLVVDLATMKYVRLILNERTYDLSIYPIYSPLSATLPSLRAEFRPITGVNASVSIYADDAIITQNEP